ncbi:hypothetical protein [Rhizobium sp. GN54]|uniref:hypothetical protein n=1 Tax=Rhizobium sp. GN54 TaxID=2898150 RepID=UPI001E469037|nr:hypothetical protein [Rhizobium sp. GN54]MCD2184810.1 hypothetical protein [Rhizobium sp. GN54]
MKDLKIALRGATRSEIVKLGQSMSSITIIYVPHDERKAMPFGRRQKVKGQLGVRAESTRIDKGSGTILAFI